MSRRPNITPSASLHIHLPVDVLNELNLHLWSESEQGIPVGAYQRWIAARIKEFFNTRAVDISQYFYKPAGTFIIRGNAETCELVESMAQACLSEQMEALKNG